MGLIPWHSTPTTLAGQEHKTDHSYLYNDTFWVSMLVFGGVQPTRHPEKVWRDHKKIPIKHEACLRRYDWTQVCIKTLLETFFSPHKKGEFFFQNRINLQFWGKCVLKATRCCSDKNKETYWWWGGLGFILPETNIEPENWWLKDRFPLRKAYLRGSNSPGSGIIFSLNICPA